jgi:hypothetical protein
MTCEDVRCALCVELCTGGVRAEMEGNVILKLRSERREELVDILKADM